MTSYSKSPLVSANDVIAENWNANITIKNANRIVVISSDGIDEIGSHDELLSNKHTYYNLYNLYEDL